MIDNEGPDGELVGYESKEKLEVELTDETEFKIVTIKDSKGRMSKGERANIAVDKMVNLYGTEVGNKLVATKVIICVFE